MKFSTIRGNVFPVFMIMVTCAGCKEAPQAGWIDSERLAVADSEAENWMSLGRNSYQHHHSPLEAISLSNVADLGFAWEYDASSRIGRVSRGLEATPIVVDGVMYTSGAWGVVYALDAATGAEKWRYDPPVDATYDRRACCDVVNRGVQVWKGRVYVATIDGFLVALDAATGKVVWKVDTLTDRSRYYTITGPPQVAKGVVVIGNSGAEYGVRGYITAYDLETGEEAWRFFIVPGDPKNGYEHPEMEMAAETWDPDSHRLIPHGSGALRAGTTCFWHPSSPFVRTMDGLCGTIRQHRLKSGTTRQRRTLSSPMSRSTAERGRCSCKLPRMDSFTYLTARQASSSRQKSTRTPTGPAMWTWKLADPWSLRKEIIKTDPKSYVPGTSAGTTGCP